MREFSSVYIRQIVEAIDDNQFTLVLHNCAAKPVHLPAVIASGARALHFGAPMDLGAALELAGSDRVVCGNLDPSGVFLQSKPEQVAELVHALLQSHSSRRNFVISSGCDVPVGTPLANLDAFFDAARDRKLC
jgi:uroporphyrinogen decarboxylase